MQSFPHFSTPPNTTGQVTFTIPAPRTSATMPAARGRRQGALWLIGIGLCVNALVMLYGHAFGQTPEIRLESAALGQAVPAAGPMLGARGIYMMPAQLGPQTFGAYLMDVDSGTICVYRVTENSKLKLMAARSYKYDRFLEDLNNEPLTPKNVQKLVEDERQRQGLQQKDEVPTVDQSPKPDENSPDLPAPTVPR